MNETKRPTINWMDLLMLGFVAGLALVPPVQEVHKQGILLALGIVQLGEGWLIAKLPRRGASYIVLLKIALATLLIDHTGETPSLNSSYWPIFILPAVTAAEYFGPWATLAWTTITSAAYCAYIVPAVQEFDVGAENFGQLALRVIGVEGFSQLAIRVLFIYLAALLVNRFSVEIRRQTKRYQELAEALAETNRRLEQAQAEARRSERLAALGQLSAGLAHEIRNPLGVIKGSAEMLTQKLGDSNPLGTELAGYISTETNRLSALVTRFLDFARPLHADLAPGDLTVVMDRALNDVAQLWKGAPVRVEKEYATNLPMVGMDEGLCEQAFLNIVQNAYDAMGAENGGVLKITMGNARRSTRDRQNADGIEIRICDSGPGIAPELREQIFNPFVTTKKSGVGLGLSIVSKIVDGHHGSIRIEDAPRDASETRGACFLIFFPAATASAAKAETEHLVIS